MNVHKVTDTFLKLNELHQRKTISAIVGNYSNYKKASIQYAALAVDSFDAAQKVTPLKYSFPIFSKTTLNVIKVTFMDLFRKKTPAEKQLKIMGHEESIRRQLFNKNVTV